MDIVPIPSVGNKRLLKVKVICYSKTCLRLSNQDVSGAVENYEHLKGLSLPENSLCKAKMIEILIGLDNYFNCVYEIQVKCHSNERITFNSTFGWIISIVMKTLNLFIPTYATY